MGVVCFLSSHTHELCTPCARPNGVNHQLNCLLLSQVMTLLLELKIKLDNPSKKMQLHK